MLGLLRNSSVRGAMINAFGGASRQRNNLCSSAASASSKSQSDNSSAPSTTVEHEDFFHDEETARHQLSEAEVMAKRQIARMSTRMHQRRIQGVYSANFDHDFSAKRLRHDLVEFGAAGTGINPGVCWPTRQQMADIQHVEAKFKPTFDQLRERTAAARQAADDAVAAREGEIEANLAKLADWRRDMLAKEERRQRDEAAKKAKMDELVREVREYIGYNVEPNDPRFQEVMEMKEAERKKAEREARKLAKQEKMMQRLMNVSTSAGQDTSAAQPSTANSADNQSKDGQKAAETQK